MTKTTSNQKKMHISIVTLILTIFLTIQQFHSKPLLYGRSCAPYPHRGIIGGGGGGFAGGLAAGYRQNQFNTNNYRRRKLFHHEIDLDQHHGSAMNKFGAGGFGGVGVGGLGGGVHDGYDRGGEFGGSMYDQDYNDYYD
ncbi:uncharacterized protein LOC113797467 isoform X2 [Dermatophagoides pteronyssinus]|uniref:uncharacterized protein LOC113797467 isoform X2 n=1 Tax=Dermatophagoides pteronyssinus TaxID=6956 RepID=UPI003F67A824